MRTPCARAECAASRCRYDGIACDDDRRTSSRRPSVVMRYSYENEQFTYILEAAVPFLIGNDGAEEFIVGDSRTDVSLN
jgi:hypothetical protein